MAKELLNVCEFSSFICYSFVSPFYLRVGLHRSTLDRAFSQHTNETERNGSVGINQHSLQII